MDEATVAVPASLPDSPEAILEECRSVLGLPDTHPITRLDAAAHEAAHVVVAATFGLLPHAAWINAAHGPDAPCCAMNLTLPGRFGSTEPADAITGEDAVRRWESRVPAARVDLNVLSPAPSTVAELARGDVRPARPAARRGSRTRGCRTARVAAADVL